MSGGYVPTRQELDQIVTYIKQDIERELSWAKFWDVTRGGLIERFARRLTRRYVANDGAGNYLAALGLLCYTEAFGKFKRRKRGVSDAPGDSFREFFCLLGPEYSALLQSTSNLYGDLRCAFAHEYSPKYIEVAPYGGNVPRVNHSGVWRLDVDRYYKDLMEAVETHKSQLHG